MSPPAQQPILVVNNPSISYLTGKDAALLPVTTKTHLDLQVSGQDSQLPVNVIHDGSRQGKKEPLSVGTLTTNEKSSSVCRGRVADFDTMVPPAWWKSIFADDMYLKTDGDVVEDPEITLSEVRILEADKQVQTVLAKGRRVEGENANAKPKQSTRILDLCCGQGRHLLQLADIYPNLELHGHDQSEFLIELARSRAAMKPHEVQDRISFTIGDCRSIPHPDESFALVLIMGNSFGYFASDNADKKVLQEVARVLQPGGVVVLDTTDGAYMRESFSPRSWEWIDDSTIVCRERQLSKDRLRLISREVVISTDKGVVRDQFYQERLYEYQELVELMREAGLQVASNGYDKLVTGQASKRGEDLGMMGQREFFVAFKQP
ncbi:hypothetical protein BGW42_007053 [Actinomortierella wolfii]|nr:hypothetical protein BGW42_007053 [Actinomortierella wolfii]